MFFLSKAPVSLSSWSSIQSLCSGDWRRFPMDYQINLPFNPKPSTLMHIDLNSCFATIEQQANPKLRGKPIAVAAYTTPSGCILAPSIEAKQRGVKTGMRVKDGKMLCPELIVLSPDPWKYRNVHMKLRKLLSAYTERSFRNFMCTFRYFQGSGESTISSGHNIFPSFTLIPVLTPLCFASMEGAKIHPDGVVYAATAIGLPRNFGFACCSIVAKQEFRSICIRVDGFGLNGRLIW